ncbi:MAG TPA: nuclear transport factor 2 family protein [Pyrinomonadaceae bacterium]|nr:nuclear transport factor 2 family protein [Pyrinomonadaceae bacterium]
MAELSERDLVEINELHDKWIGTELAGNSSQLVDLCAEEIQWIAPDARPLRGKEAIAQYLEATTVELRQVDLDDVLIGGSDMTAYLTSNYRTRFSSKGHSEIHEATGTHLWIFRKIDGKWQIVVVAWSSW